MVPPLAFPTLCRRSSTTHTCYSIIYLTPLLKFPLCGLDIFKGMPATSHGLGLSTEYQAKLSPYSQGLE